MEVKIESLAYGGAGVARAEGKVIFVEGALPDETVRIKVLKDKQRFAEARLLDVLKSSSAREKPACKHYASCGGCQYQHVSYAEELRWKTLQVKEYLARRLKISEDLVAEIVPGPGPYGYRMHATFRGSKQHKPGYVGKDNRTVIEIETCPILEPGLMPVLGRPLTAHTKLTFRLDHENKILNSAAKELYQVRVGNKLVWSNTDSFFQANRDVAAKIAEALAASVDSVKPEWFADLFAGCGLFSLLAAENAGKIFLAESDKAARRALQKNFENSKAEAVVAEGRAEAVFPAWLAETKPEKVFIFLDPPRQGLDEAFAAKLAHVKDQPCLAYLSCHLGSMTRDLESILKPGHWKVEKVQPFDMFPRTKHIEILTLLRPA